MNKNINHPKISDPRTIMRKRETAYFIWVFLSSLRINARTTHTRAAYKTIEIKWLLNIISFFLKRCQRHSMRKDNLGGLLLLYRLCRIQKCYFSDFPTRRRIFWKVCIKTHCLDRKKRQGLSGDFQFEKNKSCRLRRARWLP